MNSSDPKPGGRLPAHGAKRLIGEFRAHLGRILAGMAFLALSGAFSAGVVAMVQPIFDELLNPAGESSPFLQKLTHYVPALAAHLTDADRVWVIPAAILVLVFCSGLTNYQGNLLIGRAGQNLVAGLRARLFRQITRQDLHFFSRFTSGVLISRVISDLERLQQAVSQALGVIMFQSCVLVILLVMAFWREPRLTFLILLVIPVVAWPLSRLGRKLRRASAGSQERTGSLADVVKEAIAGREVVRVFGAEATEEKRFGVLNEDLRRFNMRAVRIGALSGPLMELVGMVAICGFLMLGFHLVHEQNWTLGQFGVYLALLWAMYEPVKKISRLNPVWQNGLVSAERAFAVLDVTALVADPASPCPAPPLADALRFEGVTFAYPDGPVVLGPVDLSVKRGDVIALVGASGAGKTTLLSLIPRFMDPVEGRITLDGVDLRELGLSSLRGHIALVPQDGVLFAGTLRDNIAYGCPGASAADVEAAAKKAHAHGFISSLPKGYASDVGEAGLGLSGGQKQRIALARAFLKDAPILLLDEATSALDAESEHAIQAATQELFKGRAVFVVAHRLSTVRDATRILVLEKGRIVEAGRHDELLARNGVYARLHALQFRAET